MRKYILFTVFNLFLLSVSAQDNLTRDEAFFQAQKAEFSAWLQSSGLDMAFSVRNLQVSSGKLSLYLSSRYQTDDSLSVAWKAIQQNYYTLNKGRISEKMLDVFTFLCDLAPEQAELIILGNQYANTHIKIYYDDYLRLEEDFTKVQAGGNINIPVDEIKFKKTVKQGKKAKTGLTVPELRRAISDFLLDYYRNKKGGWYTVDVDTTKSYFNQFTWKITCIKNEIIQENYFESIQLKVKVSQEGEEVRLEYDLQGKYAPYLLCPRQRSKFYKSMEVHYPNAIETYAEHIHNKLESYLRGY